MLHGPMKNIMTWEQALLSESSRWPRGRAQAGLMRAIENDDLDEVERILSSGADPNLPSWVEEMADDPDEAWELPLLHAVEHRSSLEVVEALLDAGADPNHADKVVSTTALHIAASSWQEDLVGVLLERGSDPGARDQRGYTPLQRLLQRFRSLRMEKYHPAMDRARESARLLVLNGGDLADFQGPEEIMDLFKGDIDWLPEGPVKAKLQRMKRGKSAFGM